MENKETKFEEVLLIRNVEEKESKAGRKYFSVNTDKGSYSVFEFDLIVDLKKNIGNKIQVECAKNDRGFQNIRRLLNVVSTEKAGPNNAVDNFADARQEKNKSMYVAYAKDIYCILLSGQNKEQTEQEQKDLMKQSCDLIKQAIKAFE